MLMASYPSRVWRSGGTRNCFTCGDSGHLAKNCPQTTGSKTYGDASCYLCGEKGHKKRDCPAQQEKPDESHQSDRVLDGAVKQKQEGETKVQQEEKHEKQRERETGQWGGAGRPKERGGVSGYRRQEGRRSRETGQTRLSGKDFSCFLCGEKGHKKRDCPQQGLANEQIHTPTSKPDAANKADKAQQTDERDSAQEQSLQGARAEPTQLTTGKDIEHPQEQDEDDVVKSKNDVTVNKPSMSTGASPSVSQSSWNKSAHRYQSTPGKNDRKSQQSSDRQYRYSGRNQFSEFSSLPSYVDTHCHLEYVLERSYLNRYGDLKRKFGYPENFRGCITSFCDPPAFSSFGLWKELLEEDGVWGTFGVHPRHARAYTDKMEEAIITCLGHSKCVGFGEMGLDYSDHCINESPADVQNQVLKRLLRLAPVMGKPLVLHCRDAEEDLLQCLTVAGVPSDWKIHLHCYSGSLRTARRFLDAFPNLYFGFTGQITYRKSESRDVAAELPSDRLLLETDSPYLIPASFKGRDYKNCHPPMAGAVVKELARARDEPADRMMTILQENCATFYGV